MRPILYILMLPFLSVLTAKGDDVPDSLFTNPPSDARPLIIWQWMDGVVTREGITADLESTALQSLTATATAPPSVSHQNKFTCCFHAGGLSLSQ